MVSQTLEASLGRAAAAGACAIGLALCAGAAGAATRTATPATFATVLATAAGGDRIVLTAGSYGPLQVSRREFSPALEIDASAATLNGMTVVQVRGLHIRGGTFRLPPPTNRRDTGQPIYGPAIRLDRVQSVTVSGGRFTGPGADETDAAAYGEGYGVFVVGGNDLEVSDNQLKGLKGGVTMTRVQNFRVLRNTFARMRSDGVQIAESRKGLIEGNSCQATRIRDVEHPDCIQLWSNPRSPPTSEVTIRANTVRGDTQGIGMFNHVRKGVDDGGFDRIIIEDNDIEVSYPHGIAIFAARDSVIRNNRVRTFGNPRWQAGINTNPPVARCGNSIAAGAGKPKKKDPPCK